MNTKSLKRVTRAAAVLALPVAASMIVTAGPATAVDAGQLLVTTTIDYDYAVIDDTDDDGNGFTSGVNGSIPVFSNDPAAATETNLYATYTQPNYSLGYTYNVEDEESTLTGEVYPTENTTLGVEVVSNAESTETTVYAGYDDGTLAYGGSYNLTTQEATVNASYTTENYSVGGEANLTTGEASVYGEVYPDENTTLGVTAANDGSSSLYGSHTTAVNDNVSVTNSFEYGLSQAPAEGEEEPVQP